MDIETAFSMKNQIDSFVNYFLANNDLTQLPPQEFIRFCRLCSSQRYGIWFQQYFTKRFGLGATHTTSGFGDAKLHTGEFVEIKTSFGDNSFRIVQLREWEPVSQYLIIFCDFSIGECCVMLVPKDVMFGFKMSRAHGDAKVAKFNRHVEKAITVTRDSTVYNILRSYEIERIVF